MKRKMMTAASAALFATAFATTMTIQHHARGEENSVTPPTTAPATPPGVVIDHIAASTGIYVGSPSIAMLGDGSYVASHDEFGPKSDCHTAAKTSVFKSTDKGKHWKKIARVSGAFWSTLFVHGDALYMLGTTKEYGDLVIRKSTTGGATWTEPKDANTGLLAAGRYHTAPVPVVEHGGRIWRGVETAQGPGAPNGWGDMFQAMVVSVPADANLLKRDNWTFTNPLTRDKAWLGGGFQGWLEGNAVLTPDGHIVDILRVASNNKRNNLAACVTVSDDGKTAAFDPAGGFLDLPGAEKKFTIRYDETTKKYWTLSNEIRPQDSSTTDPGGTRNTLALVSSADLKTWTPTCYVLYHPEWKKHGFQYVDWQFEGNDIVAVARTGYDDGQGGADNAHNANYLTFHRISNFRNLTLDDSAPGAIRK